MSLVRDNKIVQDNIKKKFPDAKYAWILHDKDSTEHKHYHYVLIFPNPRSLKSIAIDLELPYTMVDKVWSKRGILGYLTHENDPNKHYYSLDEVVSNFDIEEEKDKDNDDFDVDQEFKDYCALREGRMSLEEWFDKYKQLFCIVRHYNTRLQMYERVFNASLSSTGAGLSSRAECRVPYPCSKKPIQTAFPSKNPEQIPWIDHGSKPFIVGTDNPKPQKKRQYRKPNPRSDLNDVI